MDYGKFSDKYSGRHGTRQRATKVERRGVKAVAALEEMRRKAALRQAHAEAKAKSKGNVGAFLDALSGIFRRSA